MCRSAGCPWCHTNESGTIQQPQREAGSDTPLPTAAHTSSGECANGRSGRSEHRSNHQMRWTPSRPSATSPPPPSFHEVPVNSTSAGAVPRAPGGARHGGGSRAVTSPPRAGQSTSYGDVCGGRQVGQERVRTRGTQERQRTGARSNTTTQNAGATPGGTRASSADKEEGGSEAGEANWTVGTRKQKVEDGRAFAWGAATTQGMA